MEFDKFRQPKNKILFLLYGMNRNLSARDIGRRLRMLDSDALGYLLELSKESLVITTYRSNRLTPKGYEQAKKLYEELDMIETPRK